MRCKIRSFEEWLIERRGRQNPLEEFNESTELKEVIKDPSLDSMSACLEALESEVLQLFESFEIEIENEYGPTASYWHSYLDMVQTLLDYQRSLRIGDWDLHFRATEKMLPWFHAYDRYNYARHFTYYWCTQQKLGDTHPEMREIYLSGKFSVKRSSGRFNRLPSDQIIEQTINKEQKGKGGIIGSSTSEGTVQRWILTSHVVANLMADLKSSIGIQNDQKPPKDLGNARIEHDEKMVRKCVSLIEEWSNPFQRTEELTSLSSGVQAPEDVKQDLLNAKSTGENQLQQFIDKRVSSDTVGFYEPIKRLKLQTFTSLEVKKLRK